MDAAGRRRAATGGVGRGMMGVAVGGMDAGGRQQGGEDYLRTASACDKIKKLLR